jgi:hypothetical protein
MSRKEALKAIVEFASVAQDSAVDQADASRTSTRPC